MSSVVICFFVGALALAQPSPPNVLLITIDTVRADRIGAYGYTKGATPAIDRLAREGVRFADATSQAPLTGPAHAAILTGQYPARLGVRDNASTPIPAGTPTLATIFKARGYRTGGFVGAFILGPEYGFAQGFDTFDATFSRFNAGMKLQAQRRGGEVTDAAIKWLRQPSALSPQPFFAWVHLYDAHAPYEAPAPFRARFAAAPYDGEVAYVDSCIAKIVAALEQSGQLDRTLVAVIADHGEGLGDHGEAEHGLFLYESVLHVPWIMRLPGHDNAGAVVKTQVRAIDVLPSLAAIAGVAPPKTDGANIVPFIKVPGGPGNNIPRDPAPSYAETFYPKWHFGWSELKSVRVGDWKYIDAPKPELYDMRADAAETRNAIDARGPLAGGLSTELGKIQNGFGAAAAVTDAPQPDPETLARLRSLGYVGIASPSPGVRGPDPKDMVPKLETFKTGISRAMDALGRGNADAAITQLKALVAMNDRSYELHLFLGDAYAAKRQYDTALGEYAAARMLNAHSSAPAISEARVYMGQGDLARALQQIDAAARLDPSSSEVPLVRGEILEKMGRRPDALAQYEMAVRANGSDAQARVSLASLALQLHQYDLAKPQFEALVHMGYRPSRMHFGLAQIAEAQGDVKKAVAEYRRALQIEPGLAEARAALTRLGTP
ncbi:MAG: sulfatase-like hydrolase/transferase [Acidobacteria bacterium]|nr:sulfatase-like hydrolase/transferase [Acidobacteriota bacterium]